jgi:arylsulfatase A-like enzyme
MVGKEELYDHANDPEEHFNLADDPGYRENLLELRKLLASYKARAKK